MWHTGLKGLAKFTKEWRQYTTFVERQQQSEWGGGGDRQEAAELGHRTCSTQTWRELQKILPRRLTSTYKLSQYNVPSLEYLLFLIRAFIHFLHLCQLECDTGSTGRKAFESTAQPVLPGIKADQIYPFSVDSVVLFIIAWLQGKLCATGTYDNSPWTSFNGSHELSSQ